MTGGNLPRRLFGVAGLPVLVAAELFLRRNLEHADKYLYSFLEYFYKPLLPAIFDRPWWRLLLPIKELTGAWSATIITTHLVELRIGVPNTWYLFNALLVVVSFVSGWLVFESIAFSYTFAICMGFGTHFFHTYAVAGGMGSPLIACVFELTLACAYRFIVADRRAGWWGAAFGLSLIVCSLMYEGWLDLAAFGLAAVAVFSVLEWRHDQSLRARRLLTVGASVVVTAVVYVLVKTRFGYGQVEGSESDVIFNYRQWSPMLEDLASNIVTHIYMSVTNFLPPMLTSSTALYELGGDNLVWMQYSYHEAFGYLVAMHYLFLWQFAAGALAFGLVLLGFKLVAAAWRQRSRDRLVVLGALLMIGLAGSTHAIVKVRPMKVAPVMSYHVLVGVLGAAVLISYGALVVWRDWRSRSMRLTATACIWGVLFYGALARPQMLSHLAAQTGLGAGLYPDPMASLLAMFGRTRTQPPGLEPYVLMRRPADLPVGAELPQFGSGLPALPIAAPELLTWSRSRGVSVTRADSGYWINGNEQGGYQIASPAVHVPPHRRLLVRVDGTKDRGQVCLGVLDQKQMWLAPPSVRPADVSADTGNNEAVTFVFTTCAPGGDFVRSAFHVRSVSYAIVGSEAEVNR